MTFKLINDVAKSTGVGQRETGTGTRGNKDQLWFSPKKKTSCAVANGGVRWKKKLNGGCNA